jgi:hypothetical protein
LFNPETGTLTLRRQPGSITFYLEECPVVVNDAAFADRRAQLMALV